MMIDWLSVKVPFNNPLPVIGSSIVKLSPSGDVEWQSFQHLMCEGSFDAKIAVRKVSEFELELSGNPAKFLQGHNLIGCCDVPFLVTRALVEVCNKLQIYPTTDDLRAWEKGKFTISRIDLNVMIELQDRAEVRTFIHALSEQASVKYKGKGILKGGTLYFGYAKNGRAPSWQFKIYCKADEFDFHDLPENYTVCLETFGQNRYDAKHDYFSRAELVNYTENKLRLELTLGRHELRRKGLRSGADWNAEFCQLIFDTYRDKLQIGEGVVMAQSDCDNLPRALRRTYSDWCEGKDMRALLSKSVFYRHRRELFDRLGIDISCLQPKSAKIIPLRKTIFVDFTERLPSVLKSPVYQVLPTSPYWQSAIVDFRRKIERFEKEKLAA